MIAADWKIKEMAIKHIMKKLEKMLAKPDSTSGSLTDIVEGCTVAVA